MLSLSRCPWGGTLGRHRMPRGAPGKSVGAMVAVFAEDHTQQTRSPTGSHRFVAFGEQRTWSDFRRATICRE